MRGKKYLFIIIAAVFLICLYLITACDFSDIQDDKETAISSTQNANLKIAMYPLNENDNEFYKTLIAEYMTQYPNINIQIESVNYNNYEESLSTLISGEAPPDILRVPSGLGLNLARDEKLADISGYLKREATEKYQKGRWVTCLYKKIVFGLPETTESYAMWINKSATDKAKIELPLIPEQGWTWDELVSNLNLIINSNSEINGFGMNRDMPSLLAWIYTGGGSLFEFDLKTPALSSENDTAAISILNKMYKDKLIPDEIFSSADDNSAKRLFETGKLAIFLGSSNNLEDFKKNIKDFSFSAAYLPMPEGNNPAAYTDGLNLVVNNSTKYPREAFDFINWFTSKEITERHTSSADLLSPRTDTYSKYEDTPEIFDVFYKQAQWMSPQWGDETHIKEIKDIEQIFVDKIFTSIDGKSDIKTSLKEVESAISALF
jgi:ABC-type glycerol-3-phosphate transport system substrate-binding protein